MDDDYDYYADTESPVVASNNPTWGGGMTGFFSGLANLAGAAGTVIGAVRGNGSSQNTQAAEAVQAAQAKASAANKTMLLRGAVTIAGLAVIGFIFMRKN